MKCKKIFFIFLLVTCHLSLLTAVSAGVLDRVVAIVDDEVVLLSEFEATLQRALSSGMMVTHEEVLDGLINRILLLKQAKKIKRVHIFATRTRRDDNMLINEYIEKRIKGVIRIPFEESKLFYEENREFFSSQPGDAGADSSRDFYEVRDAIEIYLIEKEFNRKLNSYINELREKAFIRIQLKAEH